MRTRISNSAHRLPHRRDHRGVTLIETIMAVSLMTLASAALLTSLSSSVQVSTDSLRAAIATGLADQLMDEIASVKFPPASGSGSPTGMGRTGFDDLDDYNGYSVSPPQARNGMVIGTEGANSSGSSMYRPQQFQPNPRLLSGYKQQVKVEKIADAGNTWSVVSQSTTLRRVTVTISYTDGLGKTTPVAVQVRVFSNVAVAP